MKTLAVLIVSLLFVTQPALAAKPSCLVHTDVTNTMTPPELYKSYEVCMAQKKYEDAVFIFFLASAYGQYDVARVPDTTKHEAARDIIKEIVLKQSPEVQKNFADFIKEQMATPPTMYPLCKKIFAVGPPMYVPTYMAGEDGQVLTDFDINLTWLTAISQTTRCPVRNLQLDNVTHKP